MIAPADLARQARAASETTAGAVDWAMRWMKANPEWVRGHAEEMARAWIGNRIAQVDTGAQLRHAMDAEFARFLAKSELGR